MSRASYHGSGIKTTMDDLPVPQGDWKENHSRKNAKYNAVLLTGIAALAGTIALVCLLLQNSIKLVYEIMIVVLLQVRATGIIEFNYSPPSSLD